MTGVMYHCNNCGVEFDEYEFDTVEEDVDGDGYYTSFCVCPECGDDDYTEMDLCEICGEYVNDTTMIGTIEICDGCRKILTEDVLYILAKIQGDLNTDEKKARELLEYYFE